MKFVGQNHPIHDSYGKVTGQINYVGDMEFKNMLHLALVFSEIPHGKVIDIDFKDALALEGVVDVIYYGNTSQKDYNRYHNQYKQPLVHNEKIFNQHVRFVGDRIAGVIAKTEKIARKAASLVKVTYEEYPFAKDMFEVLDGKNDKVFESGGIFADTKNEFGKMPEGIEDKDLISITGETYLERIAHMCMETHACVAEYDRNDKELTIYSPNQATFGIRSLIGEIFDMDYGKVRVVKTTMGGSFGAKQEWILEPVVAAAALKVSAPVKLVYNRQENFVATNARPPMFFKTDFKFDKEGNIITAKCDLTLDAGAYVGSAMNYAFVLGTKATKAYSYPHFAFSSRVVTSNTSVTGPFRGWTAPEVTIMFEHQMDMAARKLGIDPIDIRLKNVYKGMQKNPKTGADMGEYKGTALLERGRVSFDWENRKKEITEFNAKNKRYKRGMGLGFGGHINGFYPAKADFARVEMLLTETGSVLCNLSLHDHGCGSVTMAKVLASEELNTSYDNIRIKEADTMNTPFDFGCYASRTTFVLGAGVVSCAKELKEKVKIAYAQMKSVSIEDVELGDRIAYTKGKEDEVTPWSEIVKYGHEVMQKEIFASVTHESTSNPGVFASHFAYVEVDTYTGMTKVLDYLAIQDIGRVVNREICIAQTQGAALMGIGAALSEKLKVSSGAKTAPSLKDYHLINSFEAPDIRVEFLEYDNEGFGPYGAKSIGEVSHVPCTAAVVSAVNNALQIDYNKIPLSPDVILELQNNQEESF